MVTTRSERRSAKLRTCRLDIPEDAHQGGGGGGGGGGGIITTLCRNLDEKEGEGVFSKGAQ